MAIVQTPDNAGQADARPYRSALRAQQAELTRSLITRAAHESFLKNGWSGTSVRAVAASAGVSEATVYGTFGGKAGLAIALVDSVDLEADTERAGAELAAAAGDPRGQLAAVVGFDRRLFENGGAVIRIIAAARYDNADLDAAYREGRQRGDTVRHEVFSNWPAGTWRDGVDLEQALDIFAATCSMATFDALHLERGWSPDRIETWWNQVLAEQFFGVGSFEAPEDRSRSPRGRDHRR